MRGEQPKQSTRRRMAIASVAIMMLAVNVLPLTVGQSFARTASADDLGDGASVPAGSIAMMFVSLCLAGGGKPIVISTGDQTPSSSNSGYYVDCVGGHVPFVCMIDQPGTMCTYGFTPEPPVSGSARPCSRRASPSTNYPSERSG